MFARRIFQATSFCLSRQAHTPLFFTQCTTGSLSSQLKYTALYNMVAPKVEFRDHYPQTLGMEKIKVLEQWRATDIDMAALRLQEANRHFLYQGNEADHPQKVKREAAVLVPLFLAAERISVLLTRRTSKLSTHQGEVCLPGGKCDEQDTDISMTALRETEEEVGISRQGVTILTKLPSVTSKHGVRVHPVVGLLGLDTCHPMMASSSSSLSSQPSSALGLNINPLEVAAVITAPLHVFLSQHNHRYEDRTYQGPSGAYRKRVHFFEVDGNTVWGLTASVLIETARIAYGREPEFVVSCDPSVPGPQ